MIKIKTIALLPCFLLLLMENTSAQDDTLVQVPGLMKNVLTFNFGISPYLDMGIFYLRYDRVLLQDKLGPTKSLWAMAGAGRWVGWDGRGFNFNMGLAALIGEKAHHLEMSAGGMLIFFHDYYRHNLSDYQYELDEYSTNPDNFDQPPTKPRRIDFLEMRPDITIGYRYQKPAGRRSFRVGMGFPTIFYLGYGFAL